MGNDISRVAVLGGGRMGEAFLAGLLRADHTTADIVVADRSEERASFLTSTYGIAAVDNVTAVHGADIVVLAVKPQDMAVLLADVASHIAAPTLVISVAAGLSTDYFESTLAHGVPVVRVMPNTPALVGEGMSVLTAGTHTTVDHLDVVEEMLAHVGRTARLSEEHFDAVTALSGSGPAYFFLVVEAMVDAGEALGLTREVATELVVQTAVGAAAMLRHTSDTPEQLRLAVTSKGGTTAAAVRELEAADIRGSFITALKAAAQRSAELGGQLAQ